MRIVWMVMVGQSIVSRLSQRMGNFKKSFVLWILSSRNILNRELVFCLGVPCLLSSFVSVIFLPVQSQGLLHSTERRPPSRKEPKP